MQMYSEWTSYTFLRGTSEWSTREEVISFLTFFLPDKSTCSTRSNTCQSEYARACVSEQYVCNWQTGWRFIIHCRELTSPLLFHSEMRKTFQTWHCLIGSVQHVWVSLWVCAPVFYYSKRPDQVAGILKSLPWIYLKKSAHMSHTNTHTYTACSPCLGSGGGLRGELNAEGDQWSGGERLLAVLTAEV